MTTLDEYIQSRRFPSPVPTFDAHGIIGQDWAINPMSLSRFVNTVERRINELAAQAARHEQDLCALQTVAEFALMKDPGLIDRMIAWRAAKDRVEGSFAR